MEKTKLTSLRVNVDTLAKIEETRKNHPYWKTSSIMNGVLDAVFNNFDDQQIYAMLREWDWKKCITNVEFDITKELKPHKSYQNG